MRQYINAFLFAGAVIFGAGTVSVFAQQADVTGYWKNGSVGAIQYQNRTTGATKPGRGSLFSYKFLPNGTYEFIGYMETTMYNCTSTLFNEIKGKYRVEGSGIHLTPSRDFWKNTNSCAAGGNKQRTQTPKKKTVSFELRRDEYGNDLICIEDGGETCYRKEEE